MVKNTFYNDNINYRIAKFTFCQMYVHLRQGSSVLFLGVFTLILFARRITNSKGHERTRYILVQIWIKIPTSRAVSRFYIETSLILWKNELTVRFIRTS